MTNRNGQTEVDTVSLLSTYVTIAANSNLSSLKSRLARLQQVCIQCSESLLNWTGVSRQTSLISGKAVREHRSKSDTYPTGEVGDRSTTNCALPTPISKDRASSALAWFQKQTQTAATSFLEMDLVAWESIEGFNFLQYNKSGLFCGL